MGVLGSMFEDSEINVDELEREKKEREENAKKNRGKMKFISTLNLNDKTPTASVVFLTEGFKVKIHNTRDFKNGKETFPKVLCKGNKCELCQADMSATTMGIWGVVDMSNSYKNSAGEIVNRPAFKILLRGVETIKVIERRRAKTKDKKLTGKLWEATASGSGFNRYYDFSLEESGVALDFEEMETIETKDGNIEIPLIQKPDGWPEYTPEPDKINIYTKLKAMPKYELDWSNEEHVNEYLRCWLALTPLVDYPRLANTPKGKKDGSANPGVNEHAPKASKPGLKKAETADDDMPDDGEEDF